MNKLLFALLGLALSGCATVSEAGAPARLTVIDRSTGQRLPTYYHQGRTWIAGTPGNKYAVALDNRSGERIMTVVSVDGVNVVTGETAASGQNGYVLAPGMHYEITGWRKSTSEVAAFVFTALPDSYAARTGRPDNVGVIGLAVFREWCPPRPAVSQLPRPWSHADALSGARDAERAAGSAGNAQPAEDAARDDRPAAAPAARESASAGALAKAQRAERLGTAHGEREGSTVGYTQFRRASERPNQLLTLYYDSYANLVARGIIPHPVRPVVPAPNPFPAGQGFVPDPRG